jgi:SSS family transporter
MSPADFLPPLLAAATVRAADQALLAAYLIGTLALGFWFMRRQGAHADAARATVPGWAAGVSLIGNKISAITTVSIPAKAYAGNLLNFPYQAIQYVAAPLAGLLIVPIYRHLGITSCYAYLERRFDGRLRLLAAATFVVASCSRLGVVLLVPTLVLATVTGWNPTLCILVFGLGATFYTAVSGLEGVIWIEVVHVGMIFLGAVATIGVAVAGTGAAWPELAAAAWQSDKLRLLDPSLDLGRITLGALLLAIPASLAPYLSDQSYVQRFVVPRDTRDAQRGLLLTLVCELPIVFLFYLVGVAIFLFHQHTGLAAGAGGHPDDVVPNFIVSHMPVGLAGVMLAAVLAAALSTLDGVMNSTASVIVVDFYERFVPPENRRAAGQVSRIAAGAVGLLGTGLALYLASLPERSIFDRAIELSQTFDGCMATFFVMGLLTTRIGPAAALCGFAGSVAMQVLVRVFTDWHFFTYGFLGIAGGLACGYAASWLFRAPGRDLADLTIHTRRGGKAAR